MLEICFLSRMIDYSRLALSFAVSLNDVFCALSRFVRLSGSSHTGKGNITLRGASVSTALKANLLALSRFSPDRVCFAAARPKTPERMRHSVRPSFSSWRGAAWSDRVTRCRRRRMPISVRVRWQQSQSLNIGPLPTCFNVLGQRSWPLHLRAHGAAPSIVGSAFDSQKSEQPLLRQCGGACDVQCARGRGHTSGSAEDPQTGRSTSIGTRSGSHSKPAVRATQLASSVAV